MASFLDQLFGLSGRVAIVTGGGGHLCSAMALGLAQSGCNLAILDIRGHKAKTTADSISKKTGVSAIGVEIDSTKEEDVRESLDKTLDKFGRADILINGAGINSPKPFLDISVAEFNEILESHLVSTLLGCQIYGKHMLSVGKGVIINVSSASAGPPLSKAFAYSVAKAGIKNLTQNLGREWGTKGVRVNAVRPGFFPTDWNKKNFITPEREHSILTHTPMRRFGNANELVGGIIYLASDASSFITGSELTIDGGFSCMSI